MATKGRSDNRRLGKVILRLGIIVVVLAVAIGIFQFKSPLEKLLTPAKVENLTTDTCYAAVTLKWDSAVRHAKGYKIQEVDENGEFKTIGTVEQDNGFAIEGYEKDKNHVYRVIAYGVDPFNGNEYDGEPSDPVEAYYDSSRYAQKIPVLSYHQILPTGVEYSTSICISEDKFEEQMKYLSDKGFTTLTMDEFRDWHAGKKEFPVKSCVITFDDGFYATYYLAYPIIKKYGQAATVFCIGHHIEPTTDEYDPKDEQSHYLGMDVIDKVREEYPRFEFESHTFNMHKRIDGQKPAKSFTYEQIVEDCEKNKEFGFRYLAYPWGTYTENFQKALKDTGYEMAFAYRPFYYATRDNDPYAVDRIKVDGKKDMNYFSKIVNCEMKKYNR